MSGQRELTKEELERLAVELRLKGVRPKEISQILKSGHSAWVIGELLRKAGVTPATIRARAVELSTEKPPHDIAQITGLSVRRVYKILQEAKGPARIRKSTEQNVDLFLSDPRSYMTERFTQSEPFGRSLLKRCAGAVTKNPIAGLRIVKPTVELLERNWKTRRAETRRRIALCLYLQSKGIEADVYRITARQELALEMLLKVFANADGCTPCEAESLHRIGKLHASWQRWDDAYSALEESIVRYRELGNSGHDLYGNGMANCLLLKCELHFCTISPEAGAAEARNALQTMTGKESPLLFGLLVFALAKCLQPSKNPREVQESQELLAWCFHNLEFAKSSSPTRAMLYWLQAQLFTVKHQRDDAIHYLKLALEDAEANRLEHDVASILADLGALNPDPRELRNTIEDFCHWDDDGELILPPWWESLGNEIRSVYDLTLNTKSQMDISVFSALREAAGGECRMPSFIIPPSAAAHSSSPWASA